MNGMLGRLSELVGKELISYFFCSWGSGKGDHAYHAVMKMSVNYLQCWMYEWWYQFNHEDLCEDRFIGWLTNFPALPNWVSIFHNSTGGSSTTSFTLQDRVFSSSMVFKCVGSVHHALNPNNPISRSPFKIPFAGLLVFKINSSLLSWRKDGVLSMVLCAVLKWFSSKVFLAMANTSMWDSRFSIPESGSPKNHCIGSSSWWRGIFGSLPYTKKKGISTLAKLGVTL